jgi:Leucine-rich repeat (LRR) protein
LRQCNQLNHFEFLSSLANNLLNKFPFEAAENMPALTWFTLRGNHIEKVPLLPFSYAKRLDKLDLGENFLTSIPAGMFNGTLIVNDLNLDYNYIEHLSPGAFESVTPRRIYLGTNRISKIHKDTFKGVEQVLELVDLEGNLLQNVSEAFAGLKHLRYLYLANNNITEIPAGIFGRFCSSLRALSISGNNITTFPRAAFSQCHQLSHLNIGYNNISVIEADDFVGWADNLDTLILRNNRLKVLERRAFKGCPKLRELSLSFNEFERIDSNAFIDVGKALESLEISFGLKSRVFPEAAIKPLQKLIWLALDNNDIEQISETSLYNQGELQYLNLESNRIGSIPHNLLHQNVHKQLLDVRMSYNLVTEIKTGTFSALPRVQTIVLTGNRIEKVRDMN